MTERDLSAFEKRVQYGEMPDALRKAAIRTADPLLVAWEMAQDIFKEAALPDHAIALLPILLAREASLHQQESI